METTVSTPADRRLTRLSTTLQESDTYPGCTHVGGAGKANGLTTNFTVGANKKYGQNDQPYEVFHSGDGVHLNLIACSGEWDNTSHEFLERFVVFADKELVCSFLLAKYLV